MGRLVEGRHPALRVSGGDRHRSRDWRRSMSNHVASALLVYTTLQIFLTMKALSGAMDYSVVPYLGLVVLVALVIPFLRRFEKRWTHLSEQAASDPVLAGPFWRDIALLWSLAIGFPLLLTWAFKVLLGTD